MKITTHYHQVEVAPRREEMFNIWKSTNIIIYNKKLQEKYHVLLINAEKRLEIRTSFLRDST